MGSDDILLSFDDLKSFGISFCRDRIRVLAKRGLFPKPVRVGAYRTAWRRSEIQSWIASLPTAEEKPRAGGPRGVVKAQTKAGR